MRPIALKALTWATVVAAVASALWLAAVEADPAAALRLTASPSLLLPLGQFGAAVAAARQTDSDAATAQPRPPL